VVTAFGADFKVLGDFLFIDNFTAGRTFHPKAVRHIALLHGNGRIALFITAE
jgi:hypothetical protein